jgi:hypothetical protein
MPRIDLSLLSSPGVERSSAHSIEWSELSGVKQCQPLNEPLMSGVIKSTTWPRVERPLSGAGNRTLERS